MKKFDIKVKSHNLTPVEVAIRWIAHHSALKEKDGVIMGASSAKQIVETVTMVKRGPLPGEVQKVAEELWSAVEGSRDTII